jgi:hypothetical protein
VYDPDDEITEYENNGKKLSVSTMENVGNYMLIICILLSILTEFTTMMIEAYVAIKEKCRKKERNELKVDFQKVRSKVIRAYWAKAKVMKKTRAVKQTRKKRSRRRLNASKKFGFKRKKSSWKFDKYDKVDSMQMQANKLERIGSNETGSKRRIVTFTSDKNISMKSRNSRKSKLRVKVSRGRKSNFKLRVGKKKNNLVNQRKMKKRKTFLAL